MDLKPSRSRNSTANTSPQRRACRIDEILRAFPHRVDGDALVGAGQHDDRHVRRGGANALYGLDAEGVRQREAEQNGVEIVTLERGLRFGETGHMEDLDRVRLFLAYDLADEVRDAGIVLNDQEEVERDRSVVRVRHSAGNDRGDA